jgi:hypothetical protein
LTAEIKKEFLALSLSLYKEALRVYTNMLGPDSPKCIDVSSSIKKNSRKLSKACDGDDDDSDDDDSDDDDNDDEE